LKMNNYIKTIETIIKRLIIIGFIGMMIDLYTIVINFKGVSRGEKLGALVTIIIAIITFFMMLIKEMDKSS
jgi:hypothetical protein